MYRLIIIQLNCSVHGDKLCPRQEKVIAILGCVGWKGDVFGTDNFNVWATVFAIAFFRSWPTSPHFRFFVPIISHFIVVFRAHSKKAVHLSWPRNKISLYYKRPLCQLSCAYLLFSSCLATMVKLVGKT